MQFGNQELPFKIWPPNHERIVAWRTKERLSTAMAKHFNLNYMLTGQGEFSVLKVEYVGWFPKKSPIMKLADISSTTERKSLWTKDHFQSLLTEKLRHQVLLVGTAWAVEEPLARPEDDIEMMLNSAPGLVLSSQIR